MGPIVSLNYAHELFFFENGFEDGQKIIHEALNTFPENKELLRASKDMFIYLHENQIIAYFNAVDAIESNPNDSIPVLQEFHSKYKNNYYFEEETFYYLAKAYFAAGQIDKGKKLIKYGLSKFPQDEDSLNLQKDYE